MDKQWSRNADACYQPNTFLDGLFGKSEQTKRHEAYWKDSNERDAKGRKAIEEEAKIVANHNQLIGQNPMVLYQYLNKMTPIPQTYAEELPHRPQLRQLGVQFEPYPNA